MTKQEKIRCPKCEAKFIKYESCEGCGKEIKKQAGLLNLYVQSPTRQYRTSGRWWREWTKRRYCPKCYKVTLKKLKEIFFIATS